MAAGLVKGEGFAVDASVMEANASRYHGKAPDELDWTDAQRQKRAVAEYLAGLEAEPLAFDSNACAHQGGDAEANGGVFNRCVHCENPVRLVGACSMPRTAPAIALLIREKTVT
jgi:hypothetical protein